MQFHQNVKGGYVRGERYRVESGEQGQPVLAPLRGGPKKPLPHGAPERFEVYREERLGLAVGDRVRFCLGGTALDGKRRISNGRIDEVAGFDRAGNVRLKSGLVVAKDYGHLDYGFVITSQTAQGKDAPKAIAAMGAQSLPAINAKQLYVTASRGKEDVTLYVDDKAAVRRAIHSAGRQLSATEMVKEQRASPQQAPSRQAHPRRPAPKTIGHATWREAVIDRARQWWRRRGSSVVRGAAKRAGFRPPATGHQPTPQLGRI
ncbi:hypothetical protein [Botrimarina mediterranea]|uniref:Uncharacterized protein n=1 Tax=Botrimarina mediterranea TaxID=2528022 RepID=A0A518K7U5_9BACT|nr:hypothetical protein [Botrimarina mediterranea]QDV73861.1 hypothetical protein Spa11_20600 [Botrimarina mediterranea]QDV78491.1 hypothetical protein K2D_20980 [Planctomycetes bacterium K2D]